MKAYKFKQRKGSFWFNQGCTLTQNDTRADEMTVARDIQLQNNPLSASAEGASASFYAS